MSFRSIMKSICDVISTKTSLLDVSLHIRVVKVSADYSELCLVVCFHENAVDCFCDCGPVVIIVS